MLETNRVAFQVVLCASAVPNPGDHRTVDMRAAGLRRAPAGRPHMAVVLVKVPRGRFGESLELGVELLDESGQIVVGQTSQGRVPVGSDFTIQVPPPPPDSREVVWSGAFAQGAPPLPPGNYLWSVTLDGQTCTESVVA